MHDCRPGPAHLDTCEFYISSRTDADFLLKYVGFIDRGQRIESRLALAQEEEHPFHVDATQLYFCCIDSPNRLFV